MVQSNIFVLQGIAIEGRKTVQKDKAFAKQIFIMSLTWNYAALQAAVLVLFKNNFVTFTFTGLIDKFANGLHLKQGKFRSVCLKYGTKHFRQIKAHLGLFVLNRSPVDVNLNVNLM